MLSVKKLLIVDDSAFFLQMMEALLRPYCDSLIRAASREEAVAALDRHPDTELVLLDMVLGDGEGFDVLQHLAEHSDALPAVIVMTARPSREDAERAALMGAIGYLAKPVSIREIAAAWERHRRPTWKWTTRLRRASLGRALVVDPGGRQSLVSFEVHDLSMSGALLLSEGPMAPGTRLELEFRFGERRARIPAEVVRVQEPSWLGPGGVGVRFDSLDAPARALLLEVFRSTAQVSELGLPEPDDDAGGAP